MTQLDIESKALDQENQRSGFDEKARAREEKRNANEAFVEKRISASTGHNPRKSSSSRDSISSGKRRSSTEGTRVEKVDRDIFRPENHGRDGQQPIEEPVGAFSVREREYSNSIRNNEAHVEPSENLAIASVVVPDENIADKKVNDTEKMNSIENKQLSPKSMAIFAIVALVVIVIGVVAAVVLTGEEENGGNAASVSSKRKTALLIVDVQDCFIGSASVTANGQVGSLPVAGSEEIIPIINRIRDEKSCLFDLVVRTQDFHPTKHISFASTFGLEPYVHITGGKGELELKCVNIGEGSCCPEALIASGIFAPTELKWSWMEH
ncbi:unnamed protein product [Cylindrotheca closterium]|uniref:Isochorismatase-like domain-containing protein n=1 Tax=Cylindrotheca closterium TaxID=2856 RepID=A0AAD2G8P9_9STRA|nr:unnamed protein product [Cylindrotheca closterium]